MATPVRLSGCASCRLSAFRLFLGLPPIRGSTLAQIHPRARGVDARLFSSFRPTIPLRNTPAIEEKRRQDDDVGASEESHTSGGAVDADVPWYLQVDAPQHPTLLHESAPLPETPEDSPALMQPLLKFVAEDLGLDDLKLLDLRELDPPPALGPELLMLFGTARSERHLHVSADRLVRWLRGRGVATQADGLLGRNELKIKLRRKARKAKMLGTHSMRGDSDDGISTGWVCLNLGTIGWSDAEAQIVDEGGRMAGFGVPQTGTTIVVQMLTEARREELDLETLWSRQLKRSQGNNAPPPSTSKSSNISSNISSKGEQTALESLEAASRQEKSRFKSQGTGWASQARFYSTTARDPARYTPPSAQVPKPLSSSESTDQRNDTQLIDGLTFDYDQKVQILAQLRDQILALPDAEALQAFDVDSATGSPRSPLLRLFHLALDNIPSAETWAWRLWVQVTARRMGHEDYDDLVDLQSLVTELRLSGIAATREQYLDLIQAIYAQPASGDEGARAQATLAMSVLDTMHSRGESILAHDVYVTLIESLVRTGAGTAEAERQLKALEFLIKRSDLPCMDEPLLLRLLDAYASQGQWERFWDVWRIPPRFRQPRSPRMYTYLYQRMASTKHQVRCIEALRFTTQEMVNEEPPVHPVGPVLGALKACIRIADPQAESIVQNLVVTAPETEKLARREFVKLLRSISRST